MLPFISSQSALLTNTFWFLLLSPFLYTSLSESKCPKDAQASLVAQMVKNSPAMWEIWVQSLGWEDSLEKGIATHSSILAWRIPRTVQSQRVGHDWATFTFTDAQIKSKLLSLTHKMAYFPFILIYSISCHQPWTQWTSPNIQNMVLFSLLCSLTCSSCIIKYLFP